MLPVGFTTNEYGHIAYNTRILGVINSNIITWTNKRVNFDEFKRLKTTLEEAGYIIILY